MASADRSSSVRERHVTWQDPLTYRDRALAMDGPTFADALTTGALPLAPALRLMDIRLGAPAVGQIVFAADPAEYHLNAMGFAHGGFAATLLDSAIGHTVLANLPKGASFTTLEIKVSFVRAISPETPTIHTDTTIIALGRRVASVESHLLDASGRVYAMASSTCLVLAAPARDA